MKKFYQKLIFLFIASQNAIIFGADSCEANFEENTTFLKDFTYEKAQGQIQDKNFLLEEEMFNEAKKLLVDYLAGRSIDLQKVEITYTKTRHNGSTCLNCFFEHGKKIYGIRFYKKSGDIWIGEFKKNKKLINSIDCVDGMFFKKKESKWYDVSSNSSLSKVKNYAKKIIRKPTEIVEKGIEKAKNAYNGTENTVKNIYNGTKNVVKTIKSVGELGHEIQKLVKNIDSITTNEDQIEKKDTNNNIIKATTETIKKVNEEIEGSPEFKNGLGNVVKTIKTTEIREAIVNFNNSFETIRWIKQTLCCS